MVGAASANLTAFGAWPGVTAKVVEGVNATLDNVILPVNEAVGVLVEMEKGDLSKSWTFAGKTYNP